MAIAAKVIRQRLPKTTRIFQKNYSLKLQKHFQKLLVKLKRFHETDMKNSKKFHF